MKEIRSHMPSIALTAFLTALSGGVPAYGADPPAPALAVSDARSPDAPAFVLLGVSPSQIERPTTPRALGISLFSTALDSDNLIPQNYALSVAPYWLAGHPALSNREYYNPSLRQSVADTLSFSVVSSRVLAVSGQKANATQIGVGVHTTVCVCHASPALEKAITRIHALQLEWLTADLALEAYTSPPGQASPSAEFDAIIKVVSEAFAATNAQPVSPEQKVAYAAAEKALRERVTTLWNQAHQTAESASMRTGATALLTAVETELAKAVTTAQRADVSRRGFGLGLASATAWLVPDSGAGDGRLTRWGVWMTPSYRADSLPLELIGVVRAIHRDEGGGRMMTDVGVRVANETQYVNWSAEYVSRFDRPAMLPAADSERIATVVDVRVRDDLYVSVTFGKDFADPTIGRPKGGLLGTLGLSIGLGGTPTVNVK